MPITDIIILAVIIIAFFAFAVALAWGDSQTREIARTSRQRALTEAHVASLKRSSQDEAAEHKGGSEHKAPARA